MRRCAGVLAAIALCACDAEPPAPVSLGSELQLQEVGTPVAVGQDGTRGAYVFGDVADATVLSGGRLAVADRMNATIHMFDSLGVPLRTLGRKGQGPGEFDILIDLVSGTDGSWMAWDSRLQRATVFDASGEIEREVNLRLAELGGYRLYAWNEPDELVFARGSTVPPPGQRRAMGQYRVVVADLGRGSADSILSLDYVEAVRLEALPEGRGGLVARVPLAPAGLLAATSSAIFHTDGRSGRVTVYDLRGRVRSVVELAVRTRPPSTDEIRRWEDRVHQLYGDTPGAERYISVVRDEAGVSEIVGPLARVIASPSGVAWFKLRDDDRWVGISEDGSVLGTTVFPGGTGIIEIDSGRLVRAYLDDFDRPTVEVRSFVLEPATR